MAVVTITDRPKSVLNRCVIEVLVVFLSCHFAFWIFLLGVGAFVIGLNQIFLFLLLIAKFVTSL